MNASRADSPGQMKAETADLDARFDELKREAAQLEKSLQAMRREADLHDAVERLRVLLAEAINFEEIVATAPPELQERFREWAVRAYEELGRDPAGGSDCE